MDFRKIPNVSIDCVIFGLSTNGINILLSKRSLNMHDEKYPVIDDWMLTSGHVLKDESLDESAMRIFQELTGIKQVYFKQFRTFGNPERVKNHKDLLWLTSRDINPRVISVAYYFLLPTEKVTLKNDNVKWFHIKKVPPLGFDHEEIITRAYDDLKQKVMVEPTIFEFLPDKFTLNELQQAYQSVLDITIDNRNFRKKIIGKTYIVPLPEKRTGISKKPANLYMFSRDIFEKTKTKHQLINF
ncbi:NUDIX hydrolase [Thermophagus sp. OGC60D27]|uniref:NUDIX hydrolase n=1 Tax=Thermophagus sp. OGC60D27 TaxID=3458415 RepID=UPI004037D0FB